MIPVGTSKTIIPAVKNAFAANAWKFESPASSKKIVLIPQMRDADSVLPNNRRRYVRWIERGVGAGFAPATGEAGGSFMTSLFESDALLHSEGRSHGAVRRFWKNDHMTPTRENPDDRFTTRKGDERFPRVVAALAGLILLALGLWAFLDPRSFFEQLATWPPYNEHFLHDVGAFQVGLGAVLVLAAIYRDALFVALGGVGIGGAMHALSHVIDRGEGGRDSDPILFAIVALILLTAAWYRRGALRPDRDR
jgi:hypothetical protein